jgi:hypothetical protein
MKSILIITSFLINTLTPVFAFDYELSEFNSKWNYSPLIENKEGDKVLQMKLFKRVMFVGQYQLPIIETTFTFVKNKDDQSSLSTIAHSIQNALDNKSTITVLNDHQIVVAGKFSKINRNFYVELKKEKDEVVILTSFVRSGFYKKIKPELLALHKELIQYKYNEVTPKTSYTNKIINTFENFFIPKAHAQSTNILTQLLTGSNTASSSSSSTSLGGVVTSLNGATTALNNTTNAINNASGAVNNAANAATTSSTTLANAATTSSTTLANAATTSSNTLANAATTSSTTIANAATTSATTIATATGQINSTLNTQGTAANANWSTTNTQLAASNVNWNNTNTQLANFNSNWAESNKIFAQMVDPNHMAKVAAYTAAGAALGSLAVSLAVQGVSAGISYFYELFTGKEKKKLEWQDFENAMNAWDTKLNDLVKLESMVDDFLTAFDFFEIKGFSNDFIKDLSNAVRDMGFDSKNMKDTSNDKNLSISCRKLNYDSAYELDEKIKDYDQIIQFATKNKVSIRGGLDYFCGQLRDLKKRLISSEQQMQDMRLMILKSQSQFYDKQKDNIEKRDADIDLVNSRRRDANKSRVSYDTEIQKHSQSASDDKKAAWVSDCLDSKNSEGLEINKDFSDSFLSKTFNYFKRKNLCSEKYDVVFNDIKKRDAETTSTLRAEETLSANMVLGSNSYVDLKLSEEQMSWLTRLKADAYCYKFAHQDINQVPKICKEYPEMLYSLNLAKGYDKAEKAYQNKCANRYSTAIKKLAFNENE